jgi:hypothetical protein
LRAPVFFETLNRVFEKGGFVFVAVVAVALGSGCARPSGTPARYTGYGGQAPIDAGRVREFEGRPAGYEVFGTVTARCRSDEGVGAMNRVLLSDVDCSEALLARALRDRAASVGADALVGRRCRAADVPRGDASKSTLVTCHAEVGAITMPALSEPPIAGTVRDPLSAPVPPYQVSDDGWRVAVSFVPKDAHAIPKPPRAADDVAELAVLPVNDIEMGDVFAFCRGACGRDAARYAVRAGAGRVGANDVVDISCARRENGWLCTGHAARLETDPVENPAAR